MPKQMPDIEMKAVYNEVIFAINQYTDEDMDPTVLGFDPKAIYLTKHLGIGPMMIAQLAVPLNKISGRHGGRGVGVRDASDSATVDDELNLVFKSLGVKR